MKLESLSKLRQIAERKEMEEFLKEFRNGLLEKIISGANDGMFDKTKTPLDVIVGQVAIIDSFFQEIEELNKKFDVEKAWEMQQEATRQAV